MYSAHFPATVCSIPRACAARWAAALLAVGGVVTAALSVMPGAFYRLLALPNGIALIALGYSLWRTARTDTTTP